MRIPLLLGLVTLGTLHCKGANKETPSTSTQASQSASATSTSAAAPKHSGAAKPHVAASASVTIAGGENVPSGGAKASPSSVGLAAVDFGPPGPLVIKGYPTPLQTGMRDYITIVGWSKDGSSAIACGQLTPIGPAKGAELADTCYFDRGGKTERVSVEQNASGGAFVGAALAEQLRQLKEGGPTTLKRDVAGNTLLPPPVTATWPFATDVVLSVSTLERKEGSNVLRIGGSVGSGDPVYPVTIAVEGRIPEIVYSASWNAVMASPSGKELAFVGHFFCAEWCNEVVVTRLGYAKLASLVYNDSGFRLHQKKDWAGSRDLFLKATWADPDAKLPPYNLACAYAQLGDAINAEKALKLAITLGGDTVKARAKQDGDFKSVLAAKWFTAATD